jgi:hypothetical protein
MKSIGRGGGRNKHAISATAFLMLPMTDESNRESVLK